MSLVVKTKVTRNVAGTEAYIEFLNATGTYDVSTNPGGFGTPNPDRNDFAAILVAVHKLVETDQEASVSAYDPLSVTSFTIAITRDVNGELKYDLYLVPIFDSGGTYVDGDIVYDNETPSAPFLKKMVDSDWVTITNDDLAGSDLDQKNSYAFIIPDAEAFQNELNAARLLKLREYKKDQCGCDEYDKARLNFDFVDGLLQAATNAHCDEAYAEAQQDVEEVLDFQDQLDG